MGRYILRYSGAQPIPADHVEGIRSTPGLQVVDESPKMLLVDGDEATLRQQLKKMPDWSLHPEIEYSLPDTRKKIR